MEVERKRLQMLDGSCLQDFEKDGSQSCSHFLLKNREIASYLCYFPVWNGLATAH